MLEGGWHESPASARHLPGLLNLTCQVIVKVSNSADQLPQLGQAFFRLDADRQRSTGGVGLGLCLCRLVAKVHGGELELENAGLRLRACVRLPV